MRPIDADKFAKLIKEFKNDAPNSEARKYVCNTLLSMLGDENQTPTINPAGFVKRGRWEEIRNAHGELEGWLCECGREVKCKERFCPSCGARMQED